MGSGSGQVSEEVCHVGRVQGVGTMGRFCSAPGALRQSGWDSRGGGEDLKGVFRDSRSRRPRGFCSSCPEGGKSVSFAIRQAASAAASERLSIARSQCARETRVIAGLMVKAGLVVIAGLVVKAGLLVIAGLMVIMCARVRDTNVNECV